MHKPILILICVFFGYFGVQKTYRYFNTPATTVKDLVSEQMRYMERSCKELNATKGIENEGVVLRVESILGTSLNRALVLRNKDNNVFAAIISADLKINQGDNVKLHQMHNINNTSSETMFFTLTLTRVQ